MVNNGTLAKKYTRRVTLEINGNAFPVAAPVK